MDKHVKTRKVFHIFWAWQDEKEERWLSRMASQGWHLVRAGIFTYTFARGEPAEVVYKLDYRILPGKERGEYGVIFRDAGWEQVCSVSNWHYFRAPAKLGMEVDIFSDTASRAGKYRRLLAVLIIFVPILNIGIIRLLRLDPAEARHAFHTPLLVAWLAIILIWSYAIVRIVLRMRRIQGKGPGRKLRQDAR